VTPVPEGHPLRGLFRRATRQAMESARLRRDPGVESHIGDGILPRFVHVDNLYRIRDIRGKRLTEIGEILMEAETPGLTGLSDDLLFQEYIGDYTLFMTGIFAGSIRRTVRRPSSPDHVLMRLGSIFVPFDDPVDYYIAQGRAAYSKASRLSRPVSSRKAMMFGELSQRFQSYTAPMGLIAAYLEADPYFRKAKRIIS